MSVAWARSRAVAGTRSGARAVARPRSWPVARALSSLVTSLGWVLLVLVWRRLLLRVHSRLIRPLLWLLLLLLLLLWWLLRRRGPLRKLLRRRALLWRRAPKVAGAACRRRSPRARLELPSLVMRRRRRLLHIRLTQWPSGKTIARKWTEAEVQLLGCLPDTEVAERTGRQLRSVIGKRLSLGRPPCPSKVRRVRRRPLVIPVRREWTLAEELMLGRRTDREVARELGRSKTSVTKKRQVLGLPAFGRQT